MYTGRGKKEKEGKKPFLPTSEKQGVRHILHHIHGLTRKRSNRFAMGEEREAISI